MVEHLFLCLRESLELQEESLSVDVRLLLQSLREEGF